MEVAVHNLLSLSIRRVHVAQLGDTGAGTLLTAFVTCFLGGSTSGGGSQEGVKLEEEEGPCSHLFM